MRTKIELLELLKEKVGYYDFNGMCRVISNMWYNDIITMDESDILNDLLSKFDPKVRYSHTGFWFTPGLDQPRIEWIDSVIKKLQDVNE